MNDHKKKSLSVFLVAFVIRIVAAIITTVTNLNPDSTADAVTFGQTAEMIARGIFNGHPYIFTPRKPSPLDLLIPFGDGLIFELWGSLLAPFWMLPGPSGFYARFANAFLGAFAIYNLYLIARHLHSHQAGVVSALPMMFYPSFIATHSTLLREAVVLFGITSAVRLLIIPSNQRSKRLKYVLASVLLYAAFILRTDNAIIYVSAIGSALVVQAVESGYVSKQVVGTGVILSPIAFILSLPVLRDGVQFLARTRELRTKGRAVYLPEIVPRTILELMAFSWVGAAYFLYAPFPWMIETIPDVLIGLEGMINIGFTVMAVWGARSLGQKDTSVTIGLLIGFGIGIVLYGVGTGNYGTGMRHRQMFLWVIFLFGGVGFAEYAKIKCCSNKKPII
jgi:4-amino-4-deoxy-L-arabinose transferase-like glycosyltransferase